MCLTRVAKREILDAVKEKKKPRRQPRLQSGANLGVKPWLALTSIARQAGQCKTFRDGDGATMQVPDLLSYSTTFVQRLPVHGVKRAGDTWRTVRRPLSDRRVAAHLSGELSVATLPRWYPSYAALDVDDRPLSRVEDLRAELGLSDRNSLLCKSESADSWHVLFRPVYNARPPTVRLLRDLVLPWASEHGCEAYPQPDRLFRLPFGPLQTVLGHEAAAWPERLTDFRRLEEYDLSRVPAQRWFDFGTRTGGAVPVAAQGAELFAHGLQTPHSRHDSQWRVLYWLWRQNTDFDSAVEASWRWILRKHNGLSEDVKANPRRVHEELRRQASWIWSRYDRLPDSAHNEYNGWVARRDLPEILRHAGGGLPRARFLFQLVRYVNPRGELSRVRVHNDLLRAWSHETTYLRRIGELEEAGLVTRDHYWVPRVRSKALVLRWPRSPFAEAVLVDERTPDTLEASLLASYPPEDVRGLLVASGVPADTASRYLRRWTSEADKTKGTDNSTPPLSGREELS